ncbi:hypothetical protein [Paenibacillus beijingensis]|uniref:DUF4386 domain-containing protein n=1 Tax=Paenibacillus beijingensis TaxID=1126833 RepID=A0A0D5NPM5_9BACL|nr:hypothetical protein [Paenibacillus beijingensis]AJY76967.1 hypothetical protein VN24_23415 [Paenibacillus beijingensis]
MTKATGSFAAGTAILAGGVLFLLATVMHPLVTDPWLGLKVLPHIAHSPVYWQFDHILMLTAILLLFSGLAAGANAVADEAKPARITFGLFIVSMTIWILILVMELTIIPHLAENWSETQSQETGVIFTGLFAYGILAGDIAMMLAWIGIALLGNALLRSNEMTRTLASTGILFGALGALGIVAMLFVSDWSIVILAATSGPVFFWVLYFGWRMLRKETER